MDRTRIAVVGAGHLGTYHLEKLAGDENAHLVGVVDTDPDRLAVAQRKHGIPGVHALGDLAQPVDAVIIATPTQTHLELALQAFSLGCDALVEKPIAATVSQAEHMVAVARRSGRILQVGQTERFNPAVAAGLAVVNQPRYIVSERLGPFSGRSTDVDVVLDLMIHDLDIVASVVDSELDEVRAVGVPVLTPEIDMAAARLAFADGTVAQLCAGRASLEASRKMRFFTMERYVSIDCVTGEAKSVRRLPPSPGSTWPQVCGETLDVRPDDALGAQDRDFVICVRTRKTPRVDGRAGLRALMLAEAVNAAITTPLSPGSAIDAVGLDPATRWGV